MIDPERMIGSLVGSALSGGFGKKKRKKGKWKSGSLLPGGSGATVGMGLLGLAFAAYDHFQQSQGGASQPRGSTPPPPFGHGSTAPYPPASVSSPGPPPPPGTASGTAVVPPPPPGVSPPYPTGDESRREQEALLILQAMIAAANADYAIDEEEKQRILERAEQGGLSPEEKELIARELEHPKGLTEIVQAVSTPRQAEEVYVASLIAIEVDTPAEQGYLRSLKQRLRLDPETALRWERELEVQV